MNVYKVTIGYVRYNPEEICVIAKNVSEAMQLIEYNLGLDEGENWVEEVKLLMKKPDQILQNK